MSSDDAYARRARRQSALESDRAALLREADGFVVVSWWQDRSGDGRKGSYEYDHRPSLDDALEAYREYQDGEYRRASAVGIFAARGGLPIAGRLEPTWLMRLVAELRREG
jgi:hypothetical protein